MPKINLETGDIEDGKPTDPKPDPFADFKYKSETKLESPKGLIAIVRPSHVKSEMGTIPTKSTAKTRIYNVHTPKRPIRYHSPKRPGEKRPKYEDLDVIWSEEQIELFLQDRLFKDL